MLIVNLMLIAGIIWNVTCETPEYLLRTKSLPEDLNFMPSLSNGHLGYTVFGNAIFMNGVYNGAGGNSRRARLPNWINITAELCDQDGSQGGKKEAAEVNYELDLRGGYFTYIESYTNRGITLEQRTYPHRYYNRALVYELIARRDPGAAAAAQQIKLISRPGEPSKAFDFKVLNEGSSAPGDFRLLRGRTKELEQQQFQPKPQEVFVLFSEPLGQPLLIEWPTSTPELAHRVIICMDRQESVARKELQDALKLSTSQLQQTHTLAWSDFWDKQFSIEIVGDALELSRIVNAGIFYLASSLPSLSSNQANEPYYGLSPTGLARGDLDADYEGHNFWDTEIWMLPVVTQFGYEYAKQLLEYRFAHLPGARYNAQLRGNQGARFPWESAFTGTEVINPCCEEIAEQEIHISPDISFGLQKFFGQSNDWAWLCERAWPLSSEVAEFLVSRSSCRRTPPAPETCHLLNVMGPDEDHSSVNDNVYTNAVSKIALDFAAWTEGVCGNSSSSRVQEWQQLQDKLVILRDEELDYHPQHEGYQPKEVVKQADTILLGYPLQFDTSSTHLNDLRYYANATRPSGPAMTWSMFAANYLGSAEAWRADEYFARGYQHYVHPEFKVWSEVPVGFKGSANFLTGIGGFLQSLIFGYGGLNFARHGNSSQLQLNTPNVPPQVSRVLVKYIRFAKTNCSWSFQYNRSSLNCTGPEEQRLELVQGKQRKLLEHNFSVTLLRGELPMYINVLK